MRNSLPVDYPSGSCIMVAIDSDLAPIIAGQLSLLLEPRLWTQDSFQIGYRAVTEVLSQMTAACFGQIVQEIRDFRGVKADFVSVPVEERTSDMYNSLNDTMAALLEARGILDDGWFSDTYTSLKDVVQAVRGTSKTEGTSIFDEVKGLLDEEADVATVIDAVSGFLTSEEQTVVEGGLLLSLIAITAANSQLLANLNTGSLLSLSKFDDIITALRGATAPGDNILEALRGTTDADATRNVIDQLI